MTAATTLVVPSGARLGVPAATAFRLWVVGFNDAGTFRLGVMNCYRPGQAAASVTVTGANPGVVSKTAHGYQGDEAIIFGGTTAPTGVTFGTVYYVLAASIAADTFRFAATPGGTAVDTTGGGGTAVTQRRPQGIMPLTEWVAATSYAIATTSGGSGLFYTGTAVATKPYRILGFIEWDASGLATIGTWAGTGLPTNMNRVQLFGPGVHLPGDIIQTVIQVESAATVCSAAYTFDDTTPTTSESTLFLAGNIDMISAANSLNADCSVDCKPSTALHCVTSLFLDSETNARKSHWEFRPAASNGIHEVINFTLKPNKSGSTTINARIGVSTGSITVATQWGVAGDSIMTLQEIMA